VPVDYHEEFWKSEVIDFGILQQDAFDKIDAVCPLERQRYMLDIVMDICRHDYSFDNFNEVSEYFKRVINYCKQMNYSEFHSETFEEYQVKLNELLNEKQIKA
jgi:V/A-type H+-transporting ATPase subunit A